MREVKKYVVVTLSHQEEQDVILELETIGFRDVSFKNSTAYVTVTADYQELMLESYIRGLIKGVQIGLMPYDPKQQVAHDARRTTLADIDEFHPYR